MPRRETPARSSASRRAACLYGCVVLVLLLVVMGWRPTSGPIPSSVESAAVVLGHPHELALGRSYDAVAVAYREGKPGEAKARLEQLSLQAPSERSRVRALLGLQAYAETRWDDAVVSLTPPPEEPLGGLADWRLLALAESAARTGRKDLATQSLDYLLAEHPESALRGPALRTLATLAAERGDPRRALEILGRARNVELGPATRRTLDALAWKLARAQGDRAVEREAGLRLLVGSPTLASELEVLDTFRPPSVVLDHWDGILTDAEVLQRARSWLAEERPSFAAATLETVPGDRRGFEWSLLKAQTLTELDKGREAYEILTDSRPAGTRERAALEWQRALAAAEVATAKKGRENPPSAQRQRWLARSREHVEQVVILDAPGHVSLHALRTLYAHLADEGRFDDSMELLRTLRRIDPQDRTGASQLWELGWQDYRTQNYTGSIGYWSQLEQIYPDDRETHRGRYWKARALEEIGQVSRAFELYRDLVRTSDTADFYVRQARERLGGELALQTAGSLSTGWPRDPRLRRCLELSDFGLDSLAALELQAVVDDGLTADARDARALDGVLQVRGGRVRSGVQVLRDAFPSLGGPYQAAVPRPVLEAYYPLPYQDAIERSARETKLDPSLVAGIIRQESAFDPTAESWAGARGLMQLMPATAREVSTKLGHGWEPTRLFDPSFSIELGTTYFRYVLDRFDGHVELSLAGYNGGPNRIRRLWKEAGPEPELDHFLENLGISESRNYVKRILVLSDSYRQLYATGP